MAEVLNIPINGYVINFVTLNELNIYGVYDPNTTSLQKVIDTFYDNYECKNIDRNSLDIYSEELAKLVSDLDIKKKMSELKLSQTSKFVLTHSCKPLFKEIPVKDFEKHIKELLNRTKTCKTIEIFCKTLTNKTIQLEVLPDFTIYDVACLIRMKEGIPICQQRLIYAGRQLSENLNLHHYNIGAAATLHIVLRLSGGMYHETSSRNGNYQTLKSNIFYIEPNLLDDKLNKQMQSLIIDKDYENYSENNSHNHVDFE